MTNLNGHHLLFHGVFFKELSKTIIVSMEQSDVYIGFPFLMCI